VIQNIETHGLNVVSFLDLKEHDSWVEGVKLFESPKSSCKCKKNPKHHPQSSVIQTPALLTSACSPFTAASNLSTTLLLSLSFGLSLGLLSGLGISIVFDLFGRNGIGVEGLELKNCNTISPNSPNNHSHNRLPAWGT
jgi:hypothetical protein